jgi:hypothetical protein
MLGRIEIGDPDRLLERIDDEDAGIFERRSADARRGRSASCAAAALATASASPATA